MDAATRQTLYPSRCPDWLNQQQMGVSLDDAVAADPPPHWLAGWPFVIVAVDVDVAPHGSDSSAMIASLNAISVGSVSSCTAISEKPPKGRSGCRRA